MLNRLEPRPNIYLPNEHSHLSQDARGKRDRHGNFNGELTEVSKLDRKRTSLTTFATEQTLTESHNHTLSIPSKVKRDRNLQALEGRRHFALETS